MNPRHVLAHLYWSTLRLEYGIRAYAREADWTLSFMRNAQDYPLGSPNVNGLLVFGAHPEIDFRKLYPNARIVDLRGLDEVSADSSIRIDHDHVSRLAADYLHSLGYRRFLGFGGKPVEPIVTRIRVFRRCLEERGQRVEELFLNHWTEQIVINPGDLKTRITRIIRKTGLPLAVYAPDDMNAEAFIQAALDLGYRIPQDIAVLGVNNSRDICEECRVPISSIDVNFSRLGYEGARLLDGLMRGDIKKFRRIIVPPLTIEKRQSTDSAAETDKAVVAIQQYIREHFAEKITIGTVLRDLHISRSMAFVRFTRAIGHPIGREIIQVRMDHARYLLANTDYKIDVVARMCGYEDTSAFGRLFKQIHQSSPAAFRKKPRV
jgi:LacI family transcriptional regulator